MTTTIVPTIETTDRGLAVTSETIAQGSGVEHRAVLQLINTYKDDLEQFGTSAFEMRKSGGRPVRTAILNEPQSTLLMTFMRNTEQVVAFKIALVKAFYQMAQQLKTGTQDALFTDDELGLSIGQPVAQLPKQLAVAKVDPRTTRNDRIAQAAREANGQWVPVTIAEFGDKQYTELAKGINYGKRSSFANGNYRAVTRDNQLYIRHTKKAA
ncbi:MAG TPA: Rha family transcriptional regulator [Enteractinococcus sp.]